MVLSERQARAMAYRLADEIETRARALMARNAACPNLATAIGIVIQAMAFDESEGGSAQ